MKRSLVVVGGSAGSIEIVERILHDLPRRFAAAACVVIHTTPRRRSELAPLFNRVGRLPAIEMAEGMSLEEAHGRLAASGLRYVHPSRLILSDADG